MKIFFQSPDHFLSQPTALALANLGHEIATDCASADAVLATDSDYELDKPTPSRVVFISSPNVYMASAIFGRRSTHAPTLAILNEDSPLDTTSSEYDDETLFRETYNATILRFSRLEPIYPDAVSELLPAMDAKRPAILLDPDYANWKCSVTHIENAGHALALCLTHPAAGNQTFNLADPRTPTIAERAHQIARLAKFRGPILALPRDRVPAHLKYPQIDLRQDLIFSSDKIRRTLGYVELVDPDDAIRRTIAAHRAHPLPLSTTPEQLAAEDALLKTLGIIR